MRLKAEILIAIGGLMVFAGTPYAAPRAVVAGSAELAKSLDNSAVDNNETVRPIKSLRPYVLGQHALAKGDMQMAAKQLGMVLAQQPNDPVLEARLFQLYVATGDFGSALPLARKIAAREPGNAFATYTLIGDSIRSNDWAKASSLAQTLTTVGSDAFLGPIIQAWGLQAQNKSSAAQEILEQLSQRPQFQAVAREHLLYLYIQQGRFAQALTLFANLSARRTPLAVRLVGAAAFAEQQQGQIEAARALLEQGRASIRPISLVRALERLDSGQRLDFEIGTPRDALALGFLQAAQQTTPNTAFPVQVMYAQLSVWLSPQRQEAWIMLAQFLQAIDQNPAGLAALDNVTFDGAMRLSAELARATLLEQAGQTERALALLEHLGSQWPERADIWLALGDIKRRLGVYEQAAQSYTQALDRLKPYQSSDARIFFARGIAYHRSKENARAEADLQAALKLNPDDPDILNYLGYSWVEEGRNLDQALDMIKKALAIRPGSGHIQDSLGWAFFRLGRYPRAIEALEDALMRLPGDADVNEHLGDVYWAVGRSQEAQYRWQAALDALDLADGVQDQKRKERLDAKIALDPAQLEQIVAPSAPAQKLP